MGNPLIWVSLCARVRIANEALNMIESIGNYVRKRRAPIPILRGGGYTTEYVPAISGESMAHAWQEWIAYIAMNKGLKVCEDCAIGYLIKQGNRTGKISNPDEFEKERVLNCVVEDVGGFLAPTDPPVKRTSRIYTGYVIPSLVDLEAATIEPQMHARHAPPSKMAQQREVREQMIYVTETASAVYAMTFGIDITGIGRYSYVSQGLVMSLNEKKKRAETVIEALYQIVGQGMFGAKRTRFDPQYMVESLVAAVSIGIVFNTSPPHNLSYIKETVEKTKRVLEFMSLKPLEIIIYSYVSENDRRRGIVVPENCEVKVDDKKLTFNNVASVEEMFARIKQIVLEAIDRFEK